MMKREDGINEFERRSTEYSDVEDKQTKMDRDSGNCEIKTKSLTLESSEFRKEKKKKNNQSKHEIQFRYDTEVGKGGSKIQ